MFGVLQRVRYWRLLPFAAGVMAMLLSGGCRSGKMGGVAAVIGGGALPESEHSLIGDIRSRRADDSGESGDRRSRGGGRRGGDDAGPTSDPGPQYYGRKRSRLLSSDDYELSPKFADDGTCLHCYGRGFRFSTEGSTRDYVDCSGCGGLGHR